MYASIFFGKYITGMGVAQYKITISARIVFSYFFLPTQGAP